MNQLRIQGALKKFWGYDTFLPLQEEAIDSVLEGRDSVVVLPTGGGKSICFQAPAVVSEGLTLVVSPLISLMKDQVDTLVQCGIEAARLDSSQSPQERDWIFDRIKARTLKLLYVSPERIFSDGFLDFLRNTTLSAIAIDEAHCISHWGHDFRPEYRALGDLKTAMPYIRIHAYTATATERVREDIVRRLRLDNPQVLVGSFDRPNLKYQVERRSNGFEQIRSVIERHRGESGIVYCIRRKDVDSLSLQLTEAGYRAAPYHAGLEHDARKQNQDRFLSEEVDIVVATVAFGMGIDKSNVRYVVHAGMPKSIEHYQQESGRAGRDGLEAECVLLYTGADYSAWKRLLGEEETEGNQVAVEKLNDIANFCSGVTCRHAALVGYFGQELGKENCQACDVCLGELDVEPDSGVISQKIISCVVRLKERFGGQHTAQVLVGSKAERITQFEHDRLSTYGILSKHKEKTVRDWIEQLVGQGCLEKHAEFSTLRLTEKGRRTLKGVFVPTLLKPAVRATSGAGSDPASWEGVDRGLFEALRDLRRQFSLERSVPAFAIFNDAALRDMARKRPTDRTRFLSVHGVGEVKAGEFAESFTGVIVDYCVKHSLPVNVQTTLNEGRSGSLTDAKRIAFKLFSEGRPVGQVARELDRAESTTFQYLVDFLENERKSDPTPWVDAKTYRRVYSVLLESDSPQLKPIYEKLGGEVPYEQIRVVRTCVENGGRPDRFSSSSGFAAERGAGIADSVQAGKSA